MKKALSVLLSVLLVFALGVTAVAKNFPPDPDGDGTVTWKDARIIMRISYGYDECDPGSALYKACDFDHSGDVNDVDARYALRVAVGMDAATFGENPYTYDPDAEVIDYDFYYWADGENVSLVVALPKDTPIEGGDFVLEYDADSFDFDLGYWNDDELNTPQLPFRAENNAAVDGSIRSAFYFARRNLTLKSTGVL